MNNNDWLPIGSIVKLKESSFRVMISGYKILKDNTFYDYLGFLYPVGLVHKNEGIIFKKDEIDNIVFIGYKNDLFNDINKVLSSDTIVNCKDILKKIGGENNE